MDDAVQHLLDRSAVSDTIMRYFLALDRFDADGVRAVLADPFTLDAGSLLGPPQATPLDQFMQELVARNWGFSRTIHINPNHLIEISGDTAKVTSYMFGAHIVGDQPEDCFWGYGIYEIDLIRVPDGWRLTRLRIEPVRTEGGNPGRIYAIAAERQAGGQGH